MYEDLFAEGNQYNLSDSDRFLAAIAQRESGGEGDNRWDVVNPESGARGAWQIIPSTYEQWAGEAGVDPNDWSPESQYKVAKTMADYYISKYGLRGAAQAWLGGEGSVGNENLSDGNTTTGDYSNDVMNFMGAPGLAMPSTKGYTTNLAQVYQNAGGRFNDPNEKLDSAFISDMLSQPTVNASQRVLNDYLGHQSNMLTATAMGAYDRNKSFFDEINKLSAASAKEGADIENKNRQKTMAAQFAEQIANSNNSNNISMYAALGQALTGINFPASKKDLADAGQFAIEQAKFDIAANKQRQADALAIAKYQLEKQKTDAYIGAQNAKASGGLLGSTSSNSGKVSPTGYGYVLEDEDGIKNNLDGLIGNPQWIRYNQILGNPGESTESKKTALEDALKVSMPYLKSLQQQGLRDSAEGLINGPIYSLAENYVKATQPSGTDPKDIEAQNQAIQDIIYQALNTPDGGYADTSGNYVASTPASRQALLKSTNQQVAKGQQVNRF